MRLVLICKKCSDVFGVRQIPEASTAKRILGFMMWINEFK